MHPLELACKQAATKLLALRFSTIRGEADKADADNLIQDCEALWQIVDPVVQALGEYAMEHFGITDKQMKGLHVDQLRGALEGNLTHCIEAAAEERARELHEEFGSDDRPDRDNGTLNAGNGVTETCRDANARLIAAAPDLLTALRECADDLEIEVEHRYAGVKDHPAMTPKYERDMAPVVCARAAIAKAEAA